MLSARRLSSIRAPIYWSTALEALGDFVFRFAFFIWPSALDQLEVAIAFGGDVLRDVGVEHRGPSTNVQSLEANPASRRQARRRAAMSGWSSIEPGSSNRDRLLTLLRSAAMPRSSA